MSSDSLSNRGAWPHRHSSWTGAKADPESIREVPVPRKAEGAPVRRLGAIPVPCVRPHHLHDPSTAKGGQRAGKSLEFVFTVLGELQTRTGDEIGDGASHQYLAWPGERHDASPKVHCDPAHVVTAELDLARVYSGANLNTERRGASRIAHAHSTPRAGPSKVASTPSPVGFTLRPR